MLLTSPRWKVIKLQCSDFYLVTHVAYRISKLFSSTNLDCLVFSLPNKLVDYANHCFKFNSTIFPKHDKCSLASLSLSFNLSLSQLQEMTLTHKIVMLTKQTEGLIFLKFFTRPPCFLDWTQIPGSHVQGHLPVCQHLLQAICQDRI